MTSFAARCLQAINFPGLVVIRRAKNYINLKFLIITLWTLSVSPFTLFGYGSDGDAWSVGDAAEKIWDTGKYVKSRSTGFPLLEIMAAPLVKAGKWYLSNQLPLIFGIILILTLFYLGERKELRHPVLMILSICFLPIIVKNCSSTMDYIPGLVCLLWSYVFMLSGAYSIGALLIGLSAGFRISDIFFFAPFALYAYRECRDIGLIIKLFLIASISGAIAYSPALLTYGVSMPFGGPIKLGLKTNILIYGYNLLAIFGILPSIVIVSCLTYCFCKIFKEKKSFFTTSFFLFHSLNLIMWCLLFLIMSDEPEYMLPMIPSVLFLLDRLTSRKTLVLIAVVLLSNHIVSVDVLGGESGDRHFKLSLGPGYTIRDLEDRLFKLSTRNLATNYRSDQKTVLMIDKPWIIANNKEWIWDTKYEMFRQKKGNLFVEGRITDENKIKRLHEDGFRLVLWKGRKWEYKYKKIDALSWSYLEMIDSLDVFFGQRVSGKAFQ